MQDQKDRNHEILRVLEEEVIFTQTFKKFNLGSLLKNQKLKQEIREKELSVKEIEIQKENNFKELEINYKEISKENKLLRSQIMFLEDELR